MLTPKIFCDLRALITVALLILGMTACSPDTASYSSIDDGDVETPGDSPCQSNGSSTSYVTEFDIAENPISEGGNWINGKEVGLDWNNVQTNGNIAFGADFVGFPSRYNDPIAHLSTAFMTFAPDQFAEAVVYRVPGYSNPDDKHEVELLLRFEITANNARGYEVLWGQDGEIYIVRWNGPLGDYTTIGGLPDSPSTTAVDGDLLRAEIIGSEIRVYLNNSLILAARDSTFSAGQPGVGFWPTSGSTLDSYGWRCFRTGNL